MENNDPSLKRSIAEQQNIKTQNEKSVKKLESKRHKPLFWAVIGGVIGAILATSITLGVLAANGMFGGGHSDGNYDGHNAYIKKPIIYLYPETETEVTVKLGVPDKLTSSYPKYADGWDIIASPNGDMIDKKTGDTLYALYWEAQRDTSSLSFDTGFIVKGEDSAEFLREKLEILGLNYKEKEEFIVYWLPKLEANRYNYIYFATAEEIANDMPLAFSVQPDTLIRVNMVFEGLDEYMEIKEQALTPAPKRSGFTVVEWGGIEL